MLLSLPKVTHKFGWMQSDHIAEQLGVKHLAQRPNDSAMTVLGFKLTTTELPSKYLVSLFSCLTKSLESHSRIHSSGFYAILSEHRIWFWHTWHKINFSTLSMRNQANKAIKRMMFGMSFPFWYWNQAWDMVGPRGLCDVFFVCIFFCFCIFPWDLSFLQMCL